MENISNTFWEATYRKNIAKMIHVCWRYTQDRQTAEDLAHDAFLVAISKASSFENKGPFEAWLRRIVVNEALQYLRAQKMQQKLEPVYEYPVHYETVYDENQDYNLLSFSEAELLEVIEYLPQHHRLVFNLYVFDNFTHAEIAAQLGISEGTSKSHLARARKKIRESLDEKIRENRKRRKFILFFIPPKYRHQFNTNLLFKTAIWSVSALLISGGIWSLFYYQNNSHIQPENFEATGPAQNIAPESNVFHKKPVGNLFSKPNAATFSENPIIVSKTLNEKSMKNLSTLGGLLIAGLTLDSANLVKDLSSRITKHDFVAPQNHEVMSDSGTFYADKLLWSETHKLYFLGDNVKVDLKNNKFMGSGKFSFLNEIHYLVVDHIPIRINNAIKLSDKKYNLVQLNKSEGEKKYGENGKYGVVEITLAE